MSYLLDTNHCIYYKNAFFKNPKFRSDFETNTFEAFEKVKAKEENIFTSIVSIGEMYYGAEKSQYKETNLKKLETLKKKIVIENLDDEIWRMFGKVKAKFEKKGKVITDFDLLIACTAKTRDHVFVSNDNDYKVISDDFLIENWSVK